MNIHNSYEVNSPEFWLRLARKTSNDQYLNTAFQVRSSLPIDCEIAKKLAGYKTHKTEKLMSFLKLVFIELIKTLGELLEHFMKRSAELSKDRAEMCHLIWSRPTLTTLESQS